MRTVRCVTRTVRCVMQGVASHSVAWENTGAVILEGAGPTVPAPLRGGGA